MFILYVLALPYILLTWIMLPFANIHYSQGVREGTLIKFSYKGVIYKNWCGQINMGGLINQPDSHGNANFVPYVLDFGIDRDKNDQKLIEKINNLIGHQVKITYDQLLISDAKVSCSDYVITEIKELK